MGTEHTKGEVMLTWFMTDKDRKKEEAGKTNLEIAAEYWKDLLQREEACVMTPSERVEYCTFIKLKLAGMK